MRKSIIASDGYRQSAEGSAPASAWLDLSSLARVELSSEASGHPVEQAFLGDTPGLRSETASPGWRAAAPGPQTLRLHFDAPQKITRVLVHFREAEHERRQEFSLEATLSNGTKRQIVRQQWSFSPSGSMDEQENYVVDLDHVVTLTLWIDPDRGRDRYPATLQAFRIEG